MAQKKNGPIQFIEYVPKSPKTSFLTKTTSVWEKEKTT